MLDVRQRALEKNYSGLEQRNFPHLSIFLSVPEKSLHATTAADEQDKTPTQSGIPKNDKPAPTKDANIVNIWVRARLDAYPGSFCR